MKKYLFLLVSAVFVLGITGCFGKNLKENYESMNIGTSIESYQLDLRVYGSFDGDTVNKIYKVDNYKNQEYTIYTTDATYYIVGDKSYKSNSKLFATAESDIVLTDEQVFHNTDIILKGLTNIKTREDGTNDIVGKEYKVYDITLDDSYIKDLLTALGYNTTYTTATGKVYLDGENVYKIIYKVDSLTINGTFFRINSIRQLNLNLGE